MEMEWRPLHKFCYHLLSRSTSAAQCFCRMCEKSIGLKSKSFHPQLWPAGNITAGSEPPGSLWVSDWTTAWISRSQFFVSALQRATWTSDTWYVFIHMHEIRLPHTFIPSNHKHVFLKENREIFQEVKCVFLLKTLDHWGGKVATCPCHMKFLPQLHAQLSILLH